MCRLEPLPISISAVQERLSDSPRVSIDPFGSDISLSYRSRLQDLTAVR